MTHRNPHEAAARLAKVDELSLTLELATRNMSPEMALEVVSGMTEAQWDLAARTSHVRAPSATTRAMVVERFARLAGKVVS